MNLGKQKRIARIIRPETARTVLVPLDHGTTVGPIAGLENIQHTVSDMVQGGSDAVLMHKGLVRHAGCCDIFPQAGLIVHLSASSSLSPHTNTKALVGTVEEGLRLGADAVSIHVNVGSEHEAQMLHDAGVVAEACERWGMPLLMMLYPRGPQITNSFDPEAVAHCARLGAELGADIVKVSYTGDVESFSHVVHSCPVPVVIAGGERMDTSVEILQMVHDALQAGSAGLSIGRNVFQHPQRVALMRSLRALVHNNLSVEDALNLMQNPIIKSKQQAA